MCAEIKEQSFLEAIHEMGHIQYFMAYQNLPMIFRSGANSAFHEAVGETMVYAAQSPKCLKLMKVLNSSKVSAGKELLQCLSITCFKESQKAKFNRSFKVKYNCKL